MAVKHYGMFDGIMEYEGEKRRFRQNGSFLISSTQDLKTPIEDITHIKHHLEKIIINDSLKKEILDNHLNSELLDYMYDKSNMHKNVIFEKLASNIKQLNLKHFDF